MGLLKTVTLEQTLGVEGASPGFLAKAFQTEGTASIEP